ncbi:MAG: outer membrane beta-barrel protein [Nitrosomonadales bacterium]|nr:outer membrane beta-barrel protein [Nitrosomonadales bacterium]
MKKVLAGLCVAATMATVSGAALAADSGFYLLGAAGQTTSDSNKTDLDSALTSVGAVGFSSSYSKPTVYKLQVGYQINENFAAEGGYVGSNDATYTATGGNLAGTVSASGSVSGWNLTAVGILPVANQFSLLGKLGVADIRSGASVTGPGGTASASGSKTDLTYGLGAQYNFTNAVFGRFELDSYKTGSSTSSSRSTVWTLGVGYKF